MRNFQHDLIVYCKIPLFKFGDRIKVDPWENDFDVDFTVYDYEGFFIEVLDDDYALVALPHKIDFGKPEVDKVPWKQLIKL